MEDTIGILRGLKERYEAHHKVAIADSALVAAATLSNRYISGRQLPDKAIDLVDEAASRLRMEIDSAPEEIDQLRRSVDRLTMEELALAERDRCRLRGAPCRPPRGHGGQEGSSWPRLNARWEAEKAGLNRVGDLKAKIDELRSAADKSQREGDLEAASRILYGELPALERELNAAAEAESARVAARGQAGPHGGGGGHRRRHRRGDFGLDRHPGRAHAAGRKPEAAAHGAGARESG